MSPKERRSLLTDLERLVELSAAQNAHQKLANSTPGADGARQATLVLGDLTRGNLNRTVGPYDSRNHIVGMALLTQRLDFIANHADKCFQKGTSRDHGSAGGRRAI